MSAFLGEITTFLTWILSVLGDIIDFVLDQPLLLVMVVAMPIVGFLIHYFKMLKGA